MGERKLWRFTCRADQLADGRYRVEIQSASGHTITRIGYHPLWELIRALTQQTSNTTEHTEPNGGAADEQQ